MNGIIGMTNLLLDTSLNSEQMQYAETVRSCGDALLLLINDILDFSKIEAGKLMLEALDYNVGSVLEDTLAVVGVGAICMSVVLGLRFSEWGSLGPLVLGVALSSLSYVSVFLVLGYLTQRAVLIGLVYAFIWESGMTTAVTSLATVVLRTSTRRPTIERCG